MKKEVRLKLIEAFWKSKKRCEDWKTISWEPFTRAGDGLDLLAPDKIHMQLVKGCGYVLWTPGIYECETMEFFDFEWALLDLLNVWYTTPENWDAPIFINEEAMTICIPHIDPERFEVLFAHPGSVLLGMHEWREAQNQWKAKLGAHRNDIALREHGEADLIRG